MNETKLMELKLALEDQERIDDLIRIKREEFEKDNSELFMRHAKNREVIIDCKEILTENAKAGFTKDGIKQRAGGVSIRVMTMLDYDDGRAFTWARQHDICLTLDTKEFKKIAKTQNIDFVTKSDKITVCFPKEIKI